MTGRRKRQLVWMLAAIITIGLQWIDMPSAGVVEKYYGHGLFPIFRTLFDFTTGFLPFPLAPVILLVIIWRTILSIKYIRRYNGLRRWREFLWETGSGAGCVVFLFYTLWGWNYQRPGISDRLDLNRAAFDSLALEKEMQNATDDLKDHYVKHASLISSGYRRENYQWDEEIRRDMEQVISRMGYSGQGRVQVRILHWKGFLMVWKTAGIYFPLSAEGHVDGGMLPVQWPATVAHEMAHGYGVTDEGECNFLAWLVCMQSSDPVVRFSGLLTYWRYVAANYRSLHHERYKTLRGEMPAFIRSVLKDIAENNERYPEFFPRMRNLTYDSYLKIQGVKEGLLSYHEVVAMVAAYRQSVLQDTENFN